MTNRNTIRHQRAFREFASIERWNAPFAVTLTLKQGLMLEGDYGKIYVKLTPERASQNLNHFLNLLNKQVNGKAHSKFKVHIPVIPILEGGSGKRLHYHLMIDCPRDDLKDGFPYLIQSLWKRTRWGYDQIDVQANADKGWITYSSKIGDKPVYLDSIDWVNYHTLD